MVTTHLLEEQLQRADEFLVHLRIAQNDRLEDIRRDAAALLHSVNETVANMATEIAAVSSQADRFTAVSGETARNMHSEVERLTAINSDLVRYLDRARVAFAAQMRQMSDQGDVISAAVQLHHRDVMEHGEIVRSSRTQVREANANTIEALQQPLQRITSAVEQLAPQTQQSQAPNMAIVEPIAALFSDNQTNVNTAIRKLRNEVRTLNQSLNDSNGSTQSNVAALSDEMRRQGHELGQMRGNFEATQIQEAQISNQIRAGVSQINDRLTGIQNVSVHMSEGVDIASNPFRLLNPLRLVRPLFRQRSHQGTREEQLPEVPPIEARSEEPGAIVAAGRQFIPSVAEPPRSVNLSLLSELFWCLFD